MGLKFITAYRDFENSFDAIQTVALAAESDVGHDDPRAVHAGNPAQRHGFRQARLDHRRVLLRCHGHELRLRHALSVPSCRCRTPTIVQETKNWAVFVHGIYHWTDKLSTTVGVRYTDDKKDVTIFRRNFNGTVSIDHVPLSFGSVRTSPKVGIDYKWTDTLMTYALYSVGFRGGGFGPCPVERAPALLVPARGSRQL